MPSGLQVKAACPLCLFLTLCLVHFACDVTSVSQSQACQPRYVSLPAHRAKVLLLGCDTSINRITQHELQAAGLFVDQLISSNKISEDSIEEVNRLIRGDRAAPIINIAITRGDRWITLSASARINAMEISSEHSSVLLVAHRKLLLSLGLEEKAQLAGSLDGLIQKHQWEVFNQESDLQWRRRFAVELARSLHPAMIEGSSIDVYVVSGRLAEPL